VLGVRLTVSQREHDARAASRPRAGRYTRRFLLGAAGALAGAFWAGCGRDDAREEPPSGAEVIDDLLRPEAAAAGAVAGVAAIAAQDRQHLRELAARAGGAAPEPGPGGDAVALKQEAVFAYVAALPRLADPELRVLVMQVLAGEAEHIAALRLRDGEDPVPDPFAGFSVAEEPAA
jgi:hypothetical protein